MLRRFVLVGVMVLAQDSMMQLIIGTLLSAAFLLFQVQASPFIDMADDLLASSASFALVVMFACATAFKYAELTGLKDLEPLLTREQRQLFILNNATLSIIILACVVGALVVSVTIFLVQVSAEGARLRREARASKARRLRLLENGTEVVVPRIEHGWFHVFLSHVWGTGQDQMRIVKQRYRNGRLTPSTSLVARARTLPSTHVSCRVLLSRVCLCRVLLSRTPRSLRVCDRADGSLIEMMPDLHCFLDVDDLEEIGDLEGYIARMSTVLVFCSKGTRSAALTSG